MVSVQPAPVIISAHLLAQVYAHACAEYPRECVGFLLGPAADGSMVDEVRRCTNVQDELHARDPLTYPREARTAYNLGVRDATVFYQSFETDHPVKIVYHSHIDVGSYFSNEDRQMAMALFDDGRPLYDLSYLVIDAQRDRIGGAKLFRWETADNDFLLIAEFSGDEHAVKPLNEAKSLGSPGHPVTPSSSSGNCS